MIDSVERTTTVSDGLTNEPLAGVTTARTERVVRTAGPTGGETARRLITLGFGIVQALLILRLVLLLLVANRDNGLVAGIIGATDALVAPFRGMFNLDAIRANQGSVLDIAALVAFVGWTLVELLLLAVTRLGSRSRETV